jgi:hypothetical protein
VRVLASVSVRGGVETTREGPSTHPRAMQTAMVEFLNCACHLVPSRIGIAWALAAGLPALCSGHVDDVTRARFDAVQDLLVELGQFEPGPFFSGLPSRWFLGPVLRFRCGRGHVHSSTDSSKVVAGACPICHDPVALTFPEDFSDPCQPSAGDYLSPRDRMRAALLGVLGARG